MALHPIADPSAEPGRAEIKGSCLERQLSRLRVNGSFSGYEALRQIYVEHKSIPYF